MMLTSPKSQGFGSALFCGSGPRQESPCGSGSRSKKNAMDIVNNQNYTLYCLFPTYLANCAISFSQCLFLFLFAFKKALALALDTNLPRSWIRSRTFHVDPNSGGKSFADLCGSGSETLPQQNSTGTQIL
jgi:hypothetical protein